MKLLILQQAEQQTLREMGVFHLHPRVRIRAQAIVRLNQGLTLQQTANEFHVHLNSIEAWRQRWNKQGLMKALFERPDSRGLKSPPLTCSTAQMSIVNICKLPLN